MQIKLDNGLEVEYYIKLITTPSKEKYSTFTIIFLQQPNFPFKLPTIGKSKILRLPEYLKNQYEISLKIKEEIYDKFELYCYCGFEFFNNSTDKKK